MSGVGKIGHFKGEYSFLSNFYLVPLLYDGIIYPSVEHAFQAAKTSDRLIKRRIAGLATPGAAKRAGGKRGIIEDFDQVAWDAQKGGVMETLVRIKFRDSALALSLLGTGDALLEEGNTWNDTYWGVCLRSGRGQNKLGLILMKIRSELGS